MDLRLRSNEVAAERASVIFPHFFIRLSLQFDDDFLYREMALPISHREIRMKQLLRKDALKVFAEWKYKSDKTQY